MTRSAGFGAARPGWADPDYRKAPKIARKLTKEQASDLAALNERTLDALDNIGITTRGLEYIADREARVAVEGNTDGDHDNLEAAALVRAVRGDEDLDRTRLLLANCIMNCGARIYEGDDHYVTANDEFFCAECAIAEAAE